MKSCYKNLYFVFTKEQNGKRASYVQPVGAGNDMIQYFEEAKNYGVKGAHYCFTKKEAQEICNAWNEGYRKNGCYLYA